MYNTYVRPLLVQARYSRLCPIKGSSGCNTCLITWTVICLTTSKFKSLEFEVRVKVILWPTVNPPVGLSVWVSDIHLGPATNFSPSLVLDFEFEFELYCDDGHSVSSSWCRAPCGADDQSLISLFDNYFLSFSCRAPSLTRGRVCNLQFNHSLVRVAQDP
jgi:hypothetical protein